MWTAFFEHLRRCGRDATIFVVALLVLPAMFAAAPLLARLNPPILIGLTLFALAGSFAAWKRACRGRHKLGPLPPLSEHERHRARQKLLRTPAAHRAGTSPRPGSAVTQNAMALHHL